MQSDFMRFCVIQIGKNKRNAATKVATVAFINRFRRGIGRRRCVGREFLEEIVVAGDGEISGIDAFRPTADRAARRAP
jgi:hypothetical protein